MCALLLRGAPCTAPPNLIFTSPASCSTLLQCFKVCAITSGGAGTAQHSAFSRPKRCPAPLRPRQQRHRRAAPGALSLRVDRHTRLPGAAVPVTSSARAAGAICTSSITWHCALGSRQARENAAPARRAAVRARATRFSHYYVCRLGGHAHSACCASVCADWQAIFHCFSHSDGMYESCLCHFPAVLRLWQRVFPRTKRAPTRFLYHRYMLYPFGATATRFQKVHLAKVGVGGCTWVGEAVFDLGGSGTPTPRQPPAAGISTNTQPIFTAI